MTTTHSPSPVLLTGGTGRTGARIARLLAERSVPVRVGSRRAEIPFDWNDSATWPGALDGMRAAYLCYSPDLAFPGVPELMASFTAAAADAGVERIVLLSGRGEDGAQAAEEVVRSAGLEWTILRCSWFAQNFSEHFLLQPVRRDRLMLPADPGIPEPFLDLDDLAVVAANAFTGDDHVGRMLELTGSRLLTLPEVAAELSAATGRRVDFVPCSPEEFVADLGSDGVPAADAFPLAELVTEIFDGRNASLTPDLRAALGREPTDFSDYAARAAATGIWDSAVTVGAR